MVMKLRGAQHHLTVIVAHAPTAVAEDAVRAALYVQLDEASSGGNEMLLR